MTSRKSQLGEKEWLLVVGVSSVRRLPVCLGKLLGAWCCGELRHRCIVPKRLPRLFGSAATVRNWPACLP